MSWILKEYEEGKKAIDKKRNAYYERHEHKRPPDKTLTAWHIEEENLKKEILKKYGKGNIKKIIDEFDEKIILFKKPLIKLDAETIGKIIGEVWEKYPSCEYEISPKELDCHLHYQRRIFAKEDSLSIKRNYRVTHRFEPSDLGIFDILAEKFYGLKKPQK